MYVHIAVIEKKIEKNEISVYTKLLKENKLNGVLFFVSSSRSFRFNLKFNMTCNLLY